MYCLTRCVLEVLADALGAKVSSIGVRGLVVGRSRAEGAGRFAVTAPRTVDAYRDVDSRGFPERAPHREAAHRPVAAQAIFDTATSRCQPLCLALSNDAIDLLARDPG